MPSCHHAIMSVHWAAQHVRPRRAARSPCCWKSARAVGFSPRICPPPTLRIRLQAELSPTLAKNKIAGRTRSISGSIILITACKEQRGGGPTAVRRVRAQPGVVAAPAPAPPVSTTARQPPSPAPLPTVSNPRAAAPPTLISEPHHEIAHSQQVFLAYTPRHAPVPCHFTEIVRRLPGSRLAS